MAKRPSLAETMRQVTVLAEPPDLTPVRPAETVPKPFHAATRLGKKKVTTPLSPAGHKQLKSLAVEQERTTEALLLEAVRDLFTKYGKPPVD